MSDLQVVILAGGLGTRLGRLSDERPKILQLVDGEPFVDLLLELLLGQGFRRFCFVLGHLGNAVLEHLERRWSDLDWTHTMGSPSRGPGGMLHDAFRMLDEVFLLQLGDTYTYAYVGRLDQQLRRDDHAVILATDCAPDQTGEIYFDGSTPVAYDKHRNDVTAWVDTGTAVMRREALRSIPAEGGADLTEMFDELIVNGRCRVERVHEPSFDIGTPSRLRCFAEHRRTDRSERPTEER